MEHHMSQCPMCVRGYCRFESDGGIVGWWLIDGGTGDHRLFGTIAITAIFVVLSPLIPSPVRFQIL